MLTRQDYRLIAQTLREAQAQEPAWYLREHTAKLAQMLAGALGSANANFNRAKFLALATKAPEGADSAGAPS